MRTYVCSKLRRDETKDLFFPDVRRGRREWPTLFGEREAAML